MNQSKMTIFPGNVFRVKANLLVLYETTEYSHTYHRIFDGLQIKGNIKQEIIQGIELKYFQLPQFEFRRVLLIDSVGKQKPTSFQTLDQIARWVLNFIPEPKPVPQLKVAGHIISFHLSEHQDTTNLKSLVDKFSILRPVHAILVGMPDSATQMHTYINNSGPFITNSSLNTSDILISLFSKLACEDCKRLTLDFRCDNAYSKVYCKNCSPMYSAYNIDKFFQGVVQNLKENCYCGKSFLLKERENHLSECPTTVYCCEDCDFYGGQCEFVKHFVEKHPKKLVDNMKEIFKKKVNPKFNSQCQVCGAFYQFGGNCNECLKRTLNARRGIS